MSLSGGFSEADIRQLLRGPSDEERATVAHRLCCRIDQGLADHERRAAAEVLRLMSVDAAEIVRRALAITLKASPDLPRDVALRLAADADSIATPILSFSPAFTDADLCEIVRSANHLRQEAIARRPTISPMVCGAIARHGGEPIVALALANDHAAFSEDGLQTVLDRFPQSASVTAGMAYRRILPLAVTERLVALVGEEVRRHLVDHHALSPETAMRVALGARERATLDLVEQAGRSTDVAIFVDHLLVEERLTFSLILRALAHGHMAFMEHALAALAGVAHHRAWLLVHDVGPLGLKAICERAGVPAHLQPAFRAGVDTFRSLQVEGGDPAHFSQRMLERFLTRPVIAPNEDADYLVGRIDTTAQQRPRQLAHA